MKKTLFLTSLVCLGSGFARAQQDAMYTHYMYNTLAINPAYAGSRDALTMTALGRFQWVGFEGAPMTQTFTVHAPIATQNIGLGLSVVNDKIGPVNSTSFYADFAYRMKLTATSRLCFGLKGGMNNFSAGLNSLAIGDQNDVSFSQNARTSMKANFGFGMYYQSTHFYAGASIPKILENDFTAGSTVTVGSEERHYYVILGGMINMGPRVKFKPTMLTKIATSAPIQADFTATFIFNDILNLGAMYRTGDAFGILAGVNITEQLLLGYSFDWSTKNMTGRYNSGSHEILLRYDLIFNKEKKIKSPRYF